MDKSGCFFKSLPRKGLAKKEKKQRWKEIKAASVDGGNVRKATVI